MKTNKNTETKFDIYEMVTNMIIEKLEQGIVPWQKGWTGSWDSAISRSTGKPYSFINQMLLGFRSGEFLTFNQVTEAKGKIKKGAKSNIVVFYSPKQIKEKNPVTNEEEIKTIPILKYYRVFHISDCENITAKYDVEELRTFNSILNAEKLAMHYSETEKMPIIHKKGDRAFYRPKTDTVTMPEKEQFLTSEDYYSTLFHELTHSTGAKHRLDRIKGDVFGDVKYSKEELVAEIGASYCMNILGIETAENFENQTAYIGSWLKKLKSDKKFIISASSQAEKAVNLITKGFEFDYSEPTETEIEEISETETLVEEVVYCDEQIDTKLKPTNDLVGNTIRVNAKDLHLALEQVNKIKIPKKAIAILNQCEITVSENSISLFRTDLAVEIEKTVNADTSEKMHSKTFFVVDPIQLSKTLKSFGKAEVTLSIGDTSIEITDGNNSLAICGGTDDEKYTQFKRFEFSNAEFEKPVNVSSKKLTDAIKKVWYACSDNESKLIHTGVLFDGNKLVAVDGYRLAVHEFEVNLSETKRVIAKNALKILADVFKKDTKIEVAFSDKYAMIKSDDVVFVSRMLEGEFLEYAKNIPTQFQYENEIKTDELLNSVTYVGNFIKDNGRTPLKIDGNEISAITQTGKIKSTISKSLFEGMKPCGYNAKFLTEALKSCENTEIKLQVSNPLSPVIITDDKTLHLILPVRLKEEN